MELGDYRLQAEAFLGELNLAYYRQGAGHDPELELEPIYGRYASLFERDAVLRLQEQADQARGSDEGRRRRMLLDFALEGYVGALTKGVEEELASREFALTLEVEGEAEPMGFRDSDAIQANEPDPDRRARIERARLEAIDTRLNDLHRQTIECQHAAARDLGYRSYVHMCQESKGVDLAALHQQTSAFAAATDEQLATVLDPELRRTVGLGLHELRRSDLVRFFRSPEFDAIFPESRLVESLEQTLAGLGVDAHAQPGVHLDLESRPGKTPRAFCAPVRLPGEVYLVLTPIGGRDDYSVLFHEAGHTQHAAHIRAGDPFEVRWLGDNSVAEGFAFVLQHLVDSAQWLAKLLGVTDSERLTAYARVSRFLYVRRYTAKLSYELALHGEESTLEEMPARYSELLTKALDLAWPHETYLADVDPGFYCACYLRAWALEAQLRSHLRERFGDSWFEVPEAGEVLRGLWARGMPLAEELLGELTGQPLDFRVLLDDLALR